MDSVVHFEIPADDLTRSKKFYTEAFGWETEDYPQMDYVIARTGEVDKDRMLKKTGIINGGIASRTGFIKVPSFAINVDSIEDAVERVKKAGGKIVKEKMDIDGMGFIAYFEDTEGNVLSLFQEVK